MDTDEKTHILKNAACSFIKPETIMFHTVMKLFFYLISVLALLPCAHAEEENEGVLQIESTTEELSADIHIAREEGKEPPRSEKEDKKRRNLGIGEFVVLSLTGKSFLVGDIEKLEWEVINGKKLVTFIGKHQGVKTVKFQVSPYAKEAEDITIQAKTSTNRKKKIEFQVFLPKQDTNNKQQVTAQHARNPKTGKRGYDEWNFEAFPTETGCYAKLEITLHPTNVSFKHVEILETHLQNIPDPLPELADEHHPLEIAADVNHRNVFIDNIGSPKTMNRCKDLPEEWWWLTKFSTSRFSEPILDITTQQQHFKFDWYGAGREGVTILVEKFERGVQRTAIKQQYYQPSRKPETLTNFL